MILKVYYSCRLASIRLFSCIKGLTENLEFKDTNIIILG